MSPQPPGQYIGIVGGPGLVVHVLCLVSPQPAGQYVGIVGETGASCTRVMFGVSPTSWTIRRDRRGTGASCTCVMFGVSPTSWTIRRDRRGDRG